MSNAEESSRPTTRGGVAKVQEVVLSVSVSTSLKNVAPDRALARVEKGLLLHLIVGCLLYNVIGTLSTPLLYSTLL